MLSDRDFGDGIASVPFPHKPCRSGMEAGHCFFVCSCCEFESRADEVCQSRWCAFVLDLTRERVWGLLLLAKQISWPLNTFVQDTRVSALQVDYGEGLLAFLELPTHGLIFNAL